MKRLFCASLLACAAWFAAVACERPTEPKRHQEKVTLGIQMSPAMALVMVAKDRGMFEKHGLTVELKEFTAGKFALQAFLGGSLDFAVAGDVPVALAALQGSDMHVVTQVVAATRNEVRVVARRDPDAPSPASFFASKRRKLATSLGGGPEFYTWNFLNHFKIPRQSVEIVSQRPEDMPAALASGSVDAIAVFDPFAYLAERRLGSDAVVYTEASLYSELYVLTASKAQLEGKPRNIEALVRSLDDAAAYVREAPETAKAIVGRYTKLEKDVVEGIWNTFDFRVLLGKRLLEYWKAEEAWKAESNPGAAGAAHKDWRRILAPDALRLVNPAAVQLD